MTRNINSQENEQVIITQREIYDLTLQNNRLLQKMQAKVERIDEKVNELHEMDERSRLALDQSSDALEKANSVESEQKWLWRTILGGFILGVFGFFFQK